MTLYDDLLGSMLAELPARVKKLILVPDGILHLLPFGLLRPHPQLDPVVERHQLSVVPSATLWKRWRHDSAAVPAAALALADPAFLGHAGAAGLDESAAAQDRQWALESGARLGRLPHAMREGQALLRRFRGSPSRLRIGSEASEAFLKSAPLERYGVLHFAAHALVDDQRPQRSAVLLAAGGAKEDGLLQPVEIAALDLTGKLVVLSACDSGKGQVLLGEGVQSLGRAFFRAGARTVVASLWRLRDDEAAAFFDRFYLALANGADVAEAVATAGRDRRAAGAPAAAWAGVVVFGDASMTPVPGGVARPWLRWILVLGAVAILVWAFRSRWTDRPGSRGTSGRGAEL